MSEFRILPSFSSLRAFEAAARLGNFTRAAEELYVTHGAISHQIRTLEQELGVPLFTRVGKRVTLNEAGAEFALAVRRAFRDVTAAADQARASSRQQRLTISTLPSFAARWLSPRLGRYIELYPEYEVRLESGNHLADLEREAVDVAIRFGAGNYPGLSVELLMDDYYYVVASPRYKHGKLPRTLQELSGSTLLRSDNEPWLPWLKAAGLDRGEPVGGLIYQDASMLVRAAVDGEGIALARHAVAYPEIVSGQLVRLFETTIKCPLSYYFVCLPQAASRLPVQRFHSWLAEEVAIWGKTMGPELGAIEALERT